MRSPCRDLGDPSSTRGEPSLAQKSSLFPYFRPRGKPRNEFLRSRKRRKGKGERKCSLMKNAPHATPAPRTGGACVVSSPSSSSHVWANTREEKEEKEILLLLLIDNNSASSQWHQLTCKSWYGTHTHTHERTHSNPGG